MTRWICTGRTRVRYGEVFAELPIPELVENRRRSIAMLSSGTPALNRDEALELLEQLEAARCGDCAPNLPPPELALPYLPRPKAR
jgi:hypothetical protein